MSDTMEKGLNPGADFFNDESSESDWEDSDGDVTQTFSEADVHIMSNMDHQVGGSGDESRRGRSRERNTITALPPYNQFRVGLGISNMGKPLPRKMGENKNKNNTKMAREMSLKRLSKESVRVVHNRSRGGTPRDSLKSNDSGEALPFVAFSQSFPPARSMSAGPPQQREFRGRHRRNTSESLLAGSIIDAHVMTMRALESLNQSPSGTLTNLENSSFPKLSSFSKDRHIKLSPLRTKSIEDPDRPPHLPSHFIKTPYPFTAKKEFPKPKSRPRQHNATTGWHRMDSGYSEKVRDSYDDRKGKHVLGLASVDGEYDQRSRLQRNGDAQGVIRTRTDSSAEESERIVWLSLEKRHLRRNEDSQETRKVVKLCVPSSLTASGPAGEGKQTVDFDDQYLAKRLHDGHRQLAGSWVRRAFSARKLVAIRLGQISAWSGSAAQDNQRNASGLLATGAGFDLDMDAKSPFTEDSLMSLYRRPKSGKARYTWVHWARRIAAANTRRQTLDRQSTQSSRPRARSLDAAAEKRAPSSIHVLGASAETHPDDITTVQFVHSFSTSRILAALALMLILSVATAMLWIFLGAKGSPWIVEESRQRVDRVGSGMAMGILMLLLETLGFGAWLMLS